MTRRGSACALAVTLALGGALGDAGAKAPSPEHAYRLQNAWRFDEARAQVEALVKAHPRDPDVAFLDGYMKLLDGHYEHAVVRLEEAAKRDRPGELGQEIRELRDLAVATAKATRGFESVKGAHFEVHYAPGKDAILAPYALDALERAYAALGEDFGDRPKARVRVEIFPEVADLAKVSTLTLKEIETSGTIALCKYNRIMIVSPRALIAGYPWLDTLTHEYTHFIVSRTSHNTVPIWLHEGLAKYEERRWRASGGGGLTPTMEHLLATAIQRKRLITFEQMHPSMAKLPSQEDTALAFAEVYMVIEYLVGQVGWEGIRKIVAHMREGAPDAQAVARVAGKPFGAFQKDWRAWLAGRKLRARPGLVPQGLRFKKAKDQETAEDDAQQIGEEKARKHARLGGMLRARGRLRAAALEYEKAQALVGPGHPQVAAKLGRIYLELGDADRAIKTVEPALGDYPDQAGPQATVGASYLRKGDLDRAERHLLQAVAINPFDPALHCGLEAIYRKRSDSRAEREGAACKLLGSR